MSLVNLEKTYTYADYLTWNENERWEIIDGTPYLDNRFGRTDIYTDEDKIKVSLFPDLEIDLKVIFEVI